MPRINPATAVIAADEAPQRDHHALGPDAGDAREIRIVGDGAHLPADRREIQGAEGDREAERGDAGHLQIERADRELADAVGRRQLDVEHLLLVPEDDAERAAEQKCQADRSDQQGDAGASGQLLEDELVAEHGGERARDNGKAGAEQERAGHSLPDQRHVGAEAQAVAGGRIRKSRDAEHQRDAERRKADDEALRQAVHGQLKRSTRSQPLADASVRYARRTRCAACISGRERPSRSGRCRNPA